MYLVQFFCKIFLRTKIKSVSVVVVVVVVFVGLYIILKRASVTCTPNIRLSFTYITTGYRNAVTLSSSSLCVTHKTKKDCTLN